MKLIGAIAALLLTSSLCAQTYKVVRFEASDYRSFTFEEMSALISPHDDLLRGHICNGKDELDPFHAPARMNPMRNSLKIRSGGLTYTYQQGHFLGHDNSEIFSFHDPFLKSVKSALSRFEKLAPTSRLLRLLEESWFELVIVKGNNSFNPKIPEGRFWSGIKMAQAIPFFSTLRMGTPGPTHPFSDIGVGGEILWNPNLKIETIEEDGKRRSLDPDIALAHEMYHAFDSIRGLLDMGIVQGDAYEFETVAEYRAVYFENLVRKELGIKKRKHYGEPSLREGEDPMTAPDLLDQHGEPIYIPAPCLEENSL